MILQLLDAKIAQLTEGDGDGDGWNEKVTFLALSFSSYSTHLVMNANDVSICHLLTISLS
jgi:hypothetical protein